MFSTRYVLESGDLLGVEMGWTPGRTAGEILRRGREAFRIVEVRDPDFSSDSPEAVLVLEKVSESDTSEAAA